MHPDTVPARQPADHEQAQPVGVGEVELLLHREAFVDPGEQLLAQPEPAVVDLQREAVRHHLALHGDLGAGRGEHRGVLHQFGDQVGDVRDRAAEQPGAGERPDDHPGVVLDLADRRADHVHHPHRLAPGPAGRAAGQDDQALRVPPHTGGEVVDLEEVLQLRRVLGAPFHGVEQGQLAVQQDLAAAGQVDEDGRDAAPQFGLFDGGLDGGPLHGVDGAADLADLGLAELQLGGLGGDVHRLAVAQPQHDRGQPGAGQFVGGVAQADQLADQAPADPEGDEDREHHRDQADQTGDAAAPEQTDRIGVVAVVDGAAQPGVDRREVAEGAVGGLPPGVAVDRLHHPLGSAGTDEVRLGAGERGPGLAAAQGDVVGLVDRVQLGDVDGEQRLLVVQGVERDLVLLGGRPAGRGAQPLHRRVLLGEVLPGAHQLDHDRALPGELAALAGDERGPEAEGGLDQVGVLAERELPVQRGAADLGAQRAELVGGGEDLQVAAALGLVEPAALGVLLLLQDGEVVVGGGAGLLEGVAGGAGAGVGEPADGGPALVLQVVRVEVDRGAELLVGRTDVEPAPDVAGGGERRVRPEGGEGDDGHQEQRDDLRADRAAAQTHGVLGREVPGADGVRGMRGGVTGGAAWERERGSPGGGVGAGDAGGGPDPEAGRHRRFDTDELTRTGLVRTKCRPGARLGRDRGPRPQVCETLLRPDHSFEGRTHPLLEPLLAPLVTSPPGPPAGAPPGLSPSRAGSCPDRPRDHRSRTVVRGPRRLHDTFRTHRCRSRRVTVTTLGSRRGIR